MSLLCSAALVDGYSARRDARAIRYPPRLASGACFQPIVPIGVTLAMKVAREETCGPLAPLFRFHTEEEAMRLANATEFGLAAYFHSRDSDRIWRVGEAPEYGTVDVNMGIISTEVARFGGMKGSGLGRERARHGLDEFLASKYLRLGG